MLAQVFEGEAEFLEPADIFDCNRDNLLLLNNTLLIFWLLLPLHGAKLRSDCLLADELRDLNLSCEHDLKALNLGGLPAIAQEVLHATLELFLEKRFKTLCESEFLVGVRE